MDRYFVPLIAVDPLVGNCLYKVYHVRGVANFLQATGNSSNFESPS
jgi:hypothetical protein